MLIHSHTQNKYCFYLLLGCSSSTTTCFDNDLILSLPELHPPGVMPQGNVGTSLRVFRELIQSCRLPPHVIRKLKLVFPSREKRYGAVPLDYGVTREGKSLRDIGKRATHRSIQTNKTKKRRPLEEEDELEQYDVCQTHTHNGRNYNTLTKLTLYIK